MPPDRDPQPDLKLLPPFAPELTMADAALTEAIKGLIEQVRTSGQLTQAQLTQVLGSIAKVDEKVGLQAVELGKLLAWKEQQTNLRLDERLRAQEQAAAGDAVRFALLGALSGIVSAAGVTALFRHFLP